MKQIFSKRVRTVLLAAVLLTIVLSVAAGALGFKLPDVAVQTVLQPLRSGAQAMTRQAEGIYSYLFRYEALEEQVKALEAENAQLKGALTEMEDAARQADSVARENERLRKQCAFYRRERQRDRARGAAVRLTRDEKRDQSMAVALHVALGMVAAFAATTAIVWCVGV